MKLLIILLNSVYSFNHGAWFPVICVSEISQKKPFPIQLCYDDYVVWKNGNSWSMVKDVCPHKLAPLSQGRISENNNIECPYHGQQFDGNGKCVKIPQLENDKKIPVSNCVKAIKTHLVNDILWGFIPCEENQSENILPEEYYPILKTFKEPFFVRDFPYSVDMLLDNFMDPAHIPFAHHGLQGHRSDGSPIPMSLTKNDTNTIEVSFIDKINGKTRNGLLAYNRPAYYYAMDGDKKFLNIFMCPVKAGKCRIFFPPPFKGLPKFLIHHFCNKFFNTDIWLHNAEYQLRTKNQKYKISTNSDISTGLFRKWYKTSGLEDSEFFQLPNHLPEPLPPDKQFDPVNDHNKYCKTCSKYYKLRKRLKLI